MYPPPDTITDDADADGGGEGVIDCWNIETVNMFICCLQIRRIYCCRGNETEFLLIKNERANIANGM